jgi:predicted DNA-binding transcriptional regulator AlpA
MSPARAPLAPSQPWVARERRHSTSSLLDRPVISAEDAFRLLGIDRSTGYRAIREGIFPVPVLRVGRLIRVPTLALRRLLQLERQTDGDGI